MKKTFFFALVVLLLISAGCNTVEDAMDEGGFRYTQLFGEVESETYKIVLYQNNISPELGLVFLNNNFGKYNVVAHSGYINLNLSEEDVVWTYSVRKVNEEFIPVVYGIINNSLITRIIIETQHSNAHKDNKYNRNYIYPLGDRGKYVFLGILDNPIKSNDNIIIKGLSSDNLQLYEAKLFDK